MNTRLVRLGVVFLSAAPMSRADEGGARASHRLEVRADGTVWASGTNDCGQLGDGSVAERSRPVKVKGLSDVVAVATGGKHSVALRNDGTVWAWGDNTRGQLGDNTNLAKASPVQVMRLKNVVSIECREHHCLARKADGSVWVWGKVSDADGAAGTEDDVLVPIPVSGPTVLPAAAGHRQPNDR